MFSHIVLGSNDLSRSKIFYDALFATIGVGPGFTDPFGRVIYSHRGGNLMLTRPIDGKPATPANGGTIGFAMNTPEEAEAWHAAGVSHGGTSIEEPPGIRTNELGSLYLAYLRDPDGNKLCALHPVAA